MLQPKRFIKSINEKENSKRLNHVFQSDTTDSRAAFRHGAACERNTEYLLNLREREREIEREIDR